MPVPPAATQDKPQDATSNTTPAAATDAHAAHEAHDVLSDVDALVVDLDGTLVATDTLWESILVAIKAKPWLLLLLPLWVLGGKASFKRKVAAVARLDVTHLPWHEDVLALLRAARARGVKTVLATAAHASIAADVQTHLGLFSVVIGVDGTTNLAGRHKLARIEQELKGAPYCYVGDAPVDVPIFAAARHAILVGSANTRRRLERGFTFARVLPTPRGGLRALLRASRPHQWAKNLLLVVPLVLAHRLDDTTRVVDVLLGIACFSLCASGTYLLNDLLDLPADRRHARKRQRPFASAQLSIPTGLAAMTTMVATSFALAAAVLPVAFTAALAAYVVVTISYSVWLKRVVLVDVLVLSGLYCHRILAGALCADVTLSFWLAAFSMFVFLSLALVKRSAELRATTSGGPLIGRGYRTEDAPQVSALGTSSGIVAVLVIALYLRSDDVIRFYSHPGVLGGCLPLFLYWIARVWLLAGRGEMDEDPILFAVKDRTSYVVAALLVALVFLAR